MAITTAMVTSFKAELFAGVHDFTEEGDTFNLALYTAAADLDASTTSYSASNEVSGDGYTARGKALVNGGIDTSGTTAFVDFDDVSWTDASFTARGALIFNAGGDQAVSTHDFGEDKTVSSGTFTAQFPTADASNAIIRIA